MIIIGEKINGSIPRVGDAISQKDAGWIGHLAKVQTDAGADYIDVCASVEESIEVNTLAWLIDVVQQATDTPICIDSPSAETCVQALAYCKKPGIINSVSMEGGKIDVVFPVIADTDWGCIALLCDEKGIPTTAERRLEVFERIMEKAGQYKIDPMRLYIDPLVVSLSTDSSALPLFSQVTSAIKAKYPDIHITSGLSNISYGLPARKLINQAFVVLAMNAGMDSAILDPTSRELLGLIYAANALLGDDEYCMEFISAYRQGRIGPPVKA